MLVDSINWESSLPRHALSWTAPMILYTIFVCLELRSRVEKYLMTLATVSMILFYYSDFSLILYFCFESAGVPLLISIMLFGRQPQKVEATKTMLIYIAFPSLPLLLSILSGSTSVTQLFQTGTVWILLPFLAKMPCYLFHAWLPKAHVEASTIGSMVLAGSVMKLGSYGALNASSYLTISNAGTSIMFVGVAVLGTSMLRGVDVKTMVAYSSVLHMAVGVLGWCSLTNRGFKGMLFSNVAHTLLSPMMFLSVSVFYNTISSRDRAGLRSWQRASLPSVMVLFIFLMNGGMPPWLLSGSELLMIAGCGAKLASSVGVGLGIFASGLWTLVLAADQGRRHSRPVPMSYIVPISSGIILSSVSPLLVI